MDKNQYLPNYLSQNILFIELPSAPLFTPGIAPGLFFATPKLAGCNIFVAHDPAIHKYWILRWVQGRKYYLAAVNQIFSRISSKNPYLPPDLEKQKEEEAKRQAQEEKEKKEKENEAKKETTQDKINALKDKLAYAHRTSPEIPKLKKQIEDLQVIRDDERVLEIQEELKGLPRYGPEAAALKLEQEEIEERQNKRKEAEKEAREKELKLKNDKMKTNKARDNKNPSKSNPQTPKGERKKSAKADVSRI